MLDLDTEGDAASSMQNAAVIGGVLHCQSERRLVCEEWLQETARVQKLSIHKGQKDVRRENRHISVAGRVVDDRQLNTACTVDFVDRDRLHR